MRFVWINGDAVTWDNNELRYSIRSVIKFHPDAQICIVGHKPDWYSGDHIPVKDGHDRYKNTYRKAYIACENFKEFVLMHDDYYLLQPFRKGFCFYGFLRDRRTSQNQRGEAIRELQAKFPNVYDYNQHTPIPVWSETVLNEMPTEGIGFKQTYCSIETRYKSVPQKDVKVRGKGQPIPKAPFFSSTNNCQYLEPHFKRLYPDVSKYEIDNK